MITIHEKTAQKFDTLGLGALLPSSCVVTEEINGAYELKLSHPYDEGGKWKRIERGRILYASTPRGMQPFRIYNTKPNMSGIEVNARHIFYDLLDNQCSEISFNGTASGALAALQGTFAFAMPFSFATDISIYGEIKTGRMNPVQVLLSDDDETTSFTKGFGGELLRDGFDVFLLTAVGQDRDLSIRYGKNLVGLDVTEDEADVKTRILCYGSDGSATVDSPFIREYVYPKIYTLEDENKTRAELKAEAQALFDGGADLPLVNIKVDFITLADTVEYADYAPLEEVFLGDIVTIINQKMNFAKKARVISYEWDCLLERYNEVELGDFMPTLAASVTSGVRSGSLASAAVVGASVVAAALQVHLQDKNNPHGVTSEQTGGSSAGSSDADAVLELLAEHEENKENPHDVTLAQIGFTSGTDVPSEAVGVDGDIYLRTGVTDVDSTTKLLMHCNGEISDNGPYSTSVTNNGATADSTRYKFGTGSIKLNGSGAYFTTEYGGYDGDFTLDFWVYPTGMSSKNHCKIFSSQYYNTVGGIQMEKNGSSTAEVYNIFYTGYTSNIIQVTVPENTWTHLAFVQKNNVLSAFVNGIKQSTTLTKSSSLTTTLMRFGLMEKEESATANHFSGNLDEIRISNVARWTSNFTPPSKEYSAVSVVGELYLKQNGAWTQVLKGVA